MFTQRSLRGLILISVIALMTHVPSPARAATSVCPTTLSFGTVVNCTIGVAGEVDSFGLTAAAGDAVLVHMVGAPGAGLEVDLDVRDPSGATICSSRAGASAEALCKISVTGRHTVAAYDSGGDETGGYGLDAQRVNRPVGALSLAMARPRHGVIATAGENDWYTFAGAANQLVVARAAVLATAPIEVDLDVYSPAGDAVRATRAGSSAQVQCTLPATGTYSVRVDDGADDETGGYAATVRPECTLTGTSGADTITGTAGADVICALGGADKVTGGDGDDVIIGGTSDDTLDGGAGNDVFLSERTADGADTVTGGTGADVLSYAERAAAVAVDADVHADDGEASEHDDVRADVETLIGGAGNDTLVGSAASNTLIGGPGDDVVDGASGDDTLVSDQDADGADTFIGGTGRDQVTWADRAGAVSADPDGVADDGAAGEHDTVGTDVEALSGGAGPDVLTGGAGADFINGGAGDDIIDGGPGDDRVSGDAGVDTFIVRANDGADVIAGGSATDSISYAARNGAVNVSLNGVADDGEANEHDDVRADIENVIGGNGADTIVGTAAPNRLEGGPGNDTLRGGGGDDTLVGGSGYDTLDGGDGIDRCDPGPDGARVDYCDRT